MLRISGSPLGHQQRKCSRTPLHYKSPRKPRRCAVPGVFLWWGIGRIATHCPSLVPHDLPSVGRHGEHLQAGKTLAEALERYAREVAPGHKGYVWESRRLKALGTHAVARKRLQALAGADIAGWRDDRLRRVQPASVLREMKLLHSVLESCRRDFGWLRDNPMKDVTRPTAPPSRKRRVTADEIERL